MENSEVSYQVATIPTKEHAQKPNVLDSNVDDNEDFNLAHELRHIFRALGVFGMYCTPAAWIKADSRMSQGVRFRQFLQHIYCWFVQLLLWFNGIRFVAGSWYTEDRLQAMNIMISAWNLQSAAYCSTWYYIICTNKLPEILDLWQSICQSSKEGKAYGTSVKLTSIRRVVYALLGLCIGFIIVDFAAPVFMYFGPIEALRNDSTHLIEPFSNTGLGVQIALFSIFIFTNAAYCLPTSILLLLSLLYSHQFQKITKTFTCNITSEGKFQGCLTRLRCQHQYLAKLVLLTDDAFSFYLAVTVVCTLFSACFGMYQLVIASSGINIMTKIIIGFWIVIVTGNFLVISGICARLNEDVSCCCFFLTRVIMTIASISKFIHTFVHAKTQKYLYIRLFN